MKAKDLTPGMEVSVGGTRVEYGRKFAIVVRTGHWVHRRDLASIGFISGTKGSGWIEVERAPLCVLVMKTSRIHSIDEVRQWWRGIGRHLTDEQLTEQTRLSAEVLTNVRTTWAEYEPVRDRLIAASTAAREEHVSHDAAMQALADALAIKLGVAVIWHNDWFQIHEGMARILLGEE